MGELIPIQDPHNWPRTLTRIRKLWREGTVEILRHCELRMIQRGLDIHDLGHIIEHGRITEMSQPRSLWRYKIIGASIEGEPAACVVEVNGKLIVVTIVDLTVAK